MVLLLCLFALGGLLLAAALAVFPYRIRFLRRLDRTAFVFSTIASGILGALLAGGSGAMLWNSLMPA